MIEVKYKNQEGAELVFMTNSEWLIHEPLMLAEHIAKEELDSSGSDLADADCWPRVYKILISKTWVEVSVDMEWSPEFSATIVKEVA